MYGEAKTKDASHEVTVGRHRKENLYTVIKGNVSDNKKSKKTLTI